MKIPLLSERHNIILDNIVILNGYSKRVFEKL